jgi:hypothetical protein
LDRLDKATRNENSISLDSPLSQKTRAPNGLFAPCIPAETTFPVSSVLRYSARLSGGSAMSTLEEILDPQIDLTIEGLRRKKFNPDPISGRYYSKITSVISSACKRHGFILQRAILEQLKTCPRFEVWDDKQFPVTDTAEHIVDTIFGTPERAIQTTTDYNTQGRRSLQQDVIVYDRDKKRSRQEDIECL